MSNQYNMKNKDQEQLLKQQIFALETVTNNIEGAIIRCTCDDFFRIIYANDGFFRMIGYTREQFEQECQSSLSKLVYPEDVASMNETLTRQLEQGNTTVNVNRLFQRDGNVIWVLAKGKLAQLGDGTKEFHGILIDITNQKKIEEALRISEKKYEIAVSFSDVTTFEYNVKTRKIITNDKDYQVFGMPHNIENGVEDVIKLGIISPKSNDTIRDLYRKIDEGNPTSNATIYAYDLNGEERILDILLVSIFDQNGKPNRAVGIRKDITESLMLQREKEYGNTMTVNQILTYEANVSKDKIISYNKEWAVQLSIADTFTFSGLIREVCQNSIAPTHRQMFQDKLSKEFIVAAFASGQKVISIEYLKTINATEEPHWFRKNINIIQDKLSGDISIRCYISDIHDRKVKELKAADAQLLYENMHSKVDVMYEVNLTKNLFVSGHENWGRLFGIQQSNSYSEMMQELGEKAIHPDDREEFYVCYLHTNVLNAYANGKHELVYEYRRPNEKGEFIWVRCTMHLFEDPLTGDLRGKSYVENIDEEKKREFDLIYRAEHDLLTGFYNKFATEKHITNFLSTSDGKIGKHAFFIIDIDYFKSINDKFGHAFGDAVLSKVAMKINELFRDVDILGRIGGDEFVVLMKNVQRDKIALIKAGEICDKVEDTFEKNNQAYQISASIGIAFYNEHGKTYAELYKHSDTALYTSKESGRNRFTIYNDNMEIATSSINDISQNEFLEPKMFEKNTTEYIFRILYESCDKAEAIHAVLELIGKHYNLSRAYIFENSYYGDYTSNTFEWCNQGVSSQMKYLQDLSYAVIGDYKSNFNADGIFFMPDVSKMDERIRRNLESQGVKSMLQYSIIKNGVFSGFIGFDECEEIRIPTKREISELHNIANILGVFIQEMRAIEENTASKNIAMSIINGLDSYAYVCDPKTYRILFANDKTIMISPNTSIGSICYEALWNKSAPCEICPMRSMIEENVPKYSMQLNNLNLGVWVKATSSWIDWIDGQKMCLVDSVDITEFKL